MPPHPFCSSSQHSVLRSTLYLVASIMLKCKHNSAASQFEIQDFMSQLMCFVGSSWSLSSFSLHLCLLPSPDSNTRLLEHVNLLFSAGTLYVFSILFRARTIPCITDVFIFSPQLEISTSLGRSYLCRQLLSCYLIQVHLAPSLMASYTHAHSPPVYLLVTLMSVCSRQKVPRGLKQCLYYSLWCSKFSTMHGILSQSLVGR